MISAADTKTDLVGEERFLLTGIRWEFYRTFCDEMEGRRIRMTFDDGSLELMITKSPHEFYKKLLAKLVEITLYELDIPVRSGGSMTFQRDDLQKGYEHDECWWIAHEPNVRGRSEFDFTKDPPPDLAVEVEISSSLVNRMSIFAAMRVPEIWRFNGRMLRFLALQPDGKYQDSEHSLAFDFLKPEHLLPFLSLDEATDETTRVRQFVQWLRHRG